MNLGQILRAREWVIVRRLILIAIIIVLGLRSYGDRLSGWLTKPTPERDIVISHYEFRPDENGAKPAWIIEFKNSSRKYTYNRIELEATYLNGEGAVLETDKLVVDQRIAPGEEQTVASVDFRNRPGATKGTLKVIRAESATP
jgi:hypothetical protein